jgi:hypothetical protein
MTATGGRRAAAYKIRRTGRLVRRLYVAHVPDPSRQRFPIGARVVGTVADVPRPGGIGVFVKLEGRTQGFVDVLHLPLETHEWPSVGSVATFEILRHRRGQVRLFPVGDGIPVPRRRFPT